MCMGQVHCGDRQVQLTQSLGSQYKETTERYKQLNYYEG